jgi:hypothetical protein
MSAHGSLATDSTLMGDFNPSSKSGSDRKERFGGGRWLCRIGAATTCLLIAGCADKGYDRLSPEPTGSARAVPAAASEDPIEAFVQLVVGDLDAVWGRNFERRGKKYAPLAPALRAERACAQSADAACDAAQIDLDFQRSLQTRFGASSKAPQAYAIAHQVGHHVQRVMGIDTKVRELLAARPIAAYMVETQVELQADCLAGVWLRSTQHRELLPPLEVERAVRQASELGKELRVARKAGKLAGESFTYAIPRRRDYWFYQGFENGRIEDCDPFSVE